MSLLSRAAGLFRRSSPIEAGGNGRRWAGGKVLRAPAREIATRRQLAADRAGWLVMNDPTAAAIVDRWAADLVSDGPSITPRTDDLALRRKVSDAWSKWWDRADAEGHDDFAGLLSRAAKGIVAAGEAIILLEADEAGELVLRSIAPDQLDATVTRVASAGTVVAGIELDARGRPARLWIRPQSDIFPAAPLAARPIDARDVVHAFRRDYPGQMRGLSWLAPCITTLDQLAELRDAELALASTACLFAGVLTNTAGTPCEDVAPASGLAPGALVELPPGLDVKFSEPPAMTGSEGFKRDLLRAAAAGAGLPYELASGDLSSVNYSSMRAGFGEYRRRVDILRRTLIEAQIIRPIWRRFLAHEAMRGRLSPSLAQSLDLTTSWPGWLPIDPQKETAADIAALNAGLTTRAELVAKRGRDLADVDAERATDTFQAPAVGGNKP